MDMFLSFQVCLDELAETSSHIPGKLQAETLSHLILRGN